MYNSKWFQDYKKFLKSPQWQAVREKAFRHYGKKCYCCKSLSRIQVHHITYKNYKHPAINDIVPLCEMCHVQLKRDQRKSGLRHHAVIHYHIRTCKRRKKT